MESLDRIPISKISRATTIASTGAKVGVNYLKYYGQKLVKGKEQAKAELDQNNAEDIYDGLKSLKGSALKMAQMMSMDKTVLPKAFVEKFSLSQFSVPALSPALVVKTFKKYWGKSPQNVYDHFESEATHAASIGQVHKAEKDEKKLAVKIQYPGVAKSISSDLSLVKPFALKMFNIKSSEADRYFKEVESKLLEETNYELELKRSQEMTEACRIIPNMIFPSYYPEYSNQQVISMDWIEGIHLSEFAQSSPEPEQAHLIGQTLWDFYMFQIHELKKVHADPHPGNFLVTEEGKLTAIDFGCIKTIPLEFYEPYFELTHAGTLDDKKKFNATLRKLEILKDGDSKEEIAFFSNLFHEMISLFALPFRNVEFDFSNEEFFDKITALAQKLSQDDQLKNIDGSRGSEHFIYLNRTFFGLFNLMYDLKAGPINIDNYKNHIR